MLRANSGLRADSGLCVDLGLRANSGKSCAKVRSKFILHVRFSETRKQFFERYIEASYVEILRSQKRAYAMSGAIKDPSVCFLKPI